MNLTNKPEDYTPASIQLYLSNRDRIKREINHRLYDYISIEALGFSSYKWDFLNQTSEWYRVYETKYKSPDYNLASINSEAMLEALFDNFTFEILGHLKESLTLIQSSLQGNPIKLKYFDAVQIDVYYWNNYDAKLNPDMEKFSLRGRYCIHFMTDADKILELPTP